MVICDITYRVVVVVVVEEGLLTNFPTFVPEFRNHKMPKSDMSIGGRGLTYFPTFVPEFKNDRIPISHMLGREKSIWFKLLILSPDLLKTKIPIIFGGGQNVGSERNC